MLSLPERVAQFLDAISGRPSDEQVALTEAMFAAGQYHGTQRRLGGQLYMVHPLEVAAALAREGADRATLIAALLHDVLEDTSTSMEELFSRFGEEVGEMVKALSLNLTSLEDLYKAASHDIRLADIKIADRAANLETSSSLRKDRQLFNLEEAEEFHLGKLAVLPGVNPHLAQWLKDSIEGARQAYRSRID